MIKDAVLPALLPLTHRMHGANKVSTEVYHPHACCIRYSSIAAASHKCTGWTASALYVVITSVIIIIVVMACMLAMQKRIWLFILLLPDIRLVLFEIEAQLLLE